MPDPDPDAGKLNNDPAPKDGDPQPPKDGDPKPPDDGDPTLPKDGDPKPPEVKAPEKYEGFKVPDSVELEAELLKEFEGAARGMDLTQENAQKFVDFGVKLLEGEQKAQEDNRTETLDAWEKEIKADEEWGGDKLEETLDRGRRVIKEHGSTELHELIEKSGLGSNPHLLRFLGKLDKALGEDRTVDGKPAPSEKDAATVLYDGK